MSCDNDGLVGAFCRSMGYRSGVCRRIESRDGMDRVVDVGVRMDSLVGAGTRQDGLEGSVQVVEVGVEVCPSAEGWSEVGDWWLGCAAFVAVCPVSYEADTRTGQGVLRRPEREC